MRIRGLGIQVPWLYPLPDSFCMAPDKISAITEWPVPQKVKDLQSFLSFCNFYWCFIYGYSSITILLTQLTHMAVKWDWSAACQLAFDTLKHVFMSAPVLHHWIPNHQLWLRWTLLTTCL